MIVMTDMLKLPPLSSPTLAMKSRKPLRPYFQPDSWLWPGTSHTMSSSQ